MGAIDLTSQDVRSRVIDEIVTEQNLARKRASLKAFEIYSNRQQRFILEKLQEEFDDNTIKNMRKFLSLNLSKRMVNELASIYNELPEREFNLPEGELSEDQAKQIENLYTFGDVNNKLKLANRYFRLENQTFLQVLPRKGKIDLKVFLPHEIDVIPDPNNPEEALAYVISVFDRFDFLAQTEPEDFQTRGNALDTRPRQETINELIADPEDYRKNISRLIWWTDDFHFTTDSDGNVLEQDVSEMINPIGELPFIDVSMEKQNTFFVRDGHTITDFNVDFGAILSDVTNINRLQGYAQAFIVSEKAPQNLQLGPDKVIWLKPSGNPEEATPQFGFANPSPDLDASLRLLEMKLKIFLNSLGLDPKLIAGETRFNSGIERILALIEKMSATNSDFMKFKAVEKQVLRLMVKWSNLMQSVLPEEGGLKPELRLAEVPDNIEVDVKFAKPQMIKSDEEQVDLIKKKMEAGLMSRSEAIQDLRQVGKDMADNIIDEIDKEMSGGEVERSGSQVIGE